jgi:hypothetical protein
MYTYAATLRLHPLDKSDDEEDLVLLEAVPITPLNPKRDNKKDEVWQVDFTIYPVRTGLATAPTAASYGTSGGA